MADNTFKSSIKRMVSKLTQDQKQKMLRLLTQNKKRKASKRKPSSKK